jgi:MoaA/NifB/PqqE/SkfB family radical SAM enzyme
LRQDVLQKAAAHKNILFPVFTNGTMLSGETLTLLDKNRNLVPILSIEGNAAHTTRGAAPAYSINCSRQ